MIKTGFSDIPIKDNNNYLYKLLLIIFLFFSLCLNAESRIQTTGHIVIIIPKQEAPYQTIVNSIRRNFLINKRKEKIRVLNLASKRHTENNLLQGSRLVITLGAKALDYYLQSGIQSAFISSYITESAFYSITNRTRRKLFLRNKFAGAISLEQPLYRIISLVKLIQNDVKTVGVVLGPKTRRKRYTFFNQVKVKVDGTLYVADISYKDNPVKKLRKIFKKSELVVIIPDRASFNRNLAHWIVTLSYKHKVPVVSYSKKYAEAGALISIYSEPGQIGAQTAKMAQSYLKYPRHSLPLKLITPKYFQLSINKSVSNAFGLKLPKKEFLLRQLYELEAVEKNKQ